MNQREFLNPDGTVNKDKVLAYYTSIQRRTIKLQEKTLALEAYDDLYKLALFIGFRDLYEPLHAGYARFLMDPRWKKKMWLMPRKHFKTSMGTIAYTVWRILRNPKIKILIFSSKKKLAEGFLSGIKNIFENNAAFRLYYGDFVGTKVWNKGEILVKQAESTMIDNTFTVETGGVDEAMTSKHYDLIIFDDIVSLKNKKSMEMRLKTQHSYDEAVENLLKQGGEVVVSGTRWHFDDLYSNILEDDNFDRGGEFKCIVRSCVEGYVDIKNIWSNPGNGKQPYSIFPEKFSLQDYRKMEAKKPGVFWPNYMNYPKINKGKKFPQEVEKFFDDEVDWKKTDDYFQITDLMAKVDAENDRAAILQCCRYGKYILVLDICMIKLETDELIEKNFEMLAQVPRLNEWRIEDAGQQAGTIAYATKVLKQKQKAGKARADIDIDTVQPSGRDKDQRILQMAPYVRDGTFRFRSQYIHLNEEGEKVDMMKFLMAEMDEYPLGKYVDGLDVLSYALDVYGIYDYEAFDNDSDEAAFEKQKTIDKNNEKPYNSHDKIVEQTMAAERRQRENAMTETLIDDDIGEDVNG